MMKYECKCVSLVGYIRVVVKVYGGFALLHIFSPSHGDSQSNGPLSPIVTKLINW